MRESIKAGMDDPLAKSAEEGFSTASRMKSSPKGKRFAS
jgi:hypothetical protein